MVHFFGATSGTPTWNQCFAANSRGQESSLYFAAMARVRRARDRRSGNNLREVLWEKSTEEQVNSSVFMKASVWMDEAFEWLTSTPGLESGRAAARYGQVILASGHLIITAIRRVGLVKATLKRYGVARFVL